jgi:hypothetical protein
MDFGYEWITPMKTVIYPSGYKGTYDDTLKVGDLISSYHNGYHELVQIEPRKDAVPLFHYVTKFNASGTPRKSVKSRKCDAAYCRRATEEIAAQILIKETEIKALRKILTP